MNKNDKQSAIYGYGLTPGKFTVASLPQEIPSNLRYVSQVAAGESHAIFLLGTGQIMVCGSNHDGQLGLPKEEGKGIVSEPKLNKVELPNEDNIMITEIACGSNHSVLLAKSAQSPKLVILMGSESGLFGESVYGARAPQVSLTLPADQNEIEHIYASFGRSLAVTEQGKIYLWGEDFTGTRMEKPTMIYDFKAKIISFAAGYTHALCVNDKFDVFSWGDGTMGELGHGDFGNSSEPKKIAYFEEKKLKIMKVAAGAGFSLALCDHGEIYAFGSNSMRECGKIGDRFETPISLHMFTEEKTKAIDIFCGRNHAACITNEGEIYTWGDASAGMLGHSEKMISSAPKKLEVLVGNEITAVGLGHQYSVVVTGPYEHGLKNASTVVA